MKNWKRLYVLGALSFVAGVGSCFDRKEELPTSLLPMAQAAELSLAASFFPKENTRGIELRFEANQDILERSSETLLGNFLRDPNGRVAEFKVIVWRAADDTAPEGDAIAERRASKLKEIIGGEIPVTVVKFAEREASLPEAAVLAVME